VRGEALVHDSEELSDAAHLSQDPVLGTKQWFQGEHDNPAANCLTGATQALPILVSIMQRQVRNVTLEGKPEHFARYLTCSAA
jgi:hypothetical protein